MKINKKNVSVAIAVLAVIGFWAAKKIIEKKNDSGKMSITKIEGNPYWTCPMHPQIHLDHEGECPICHMKLVKVAQAAAEKNSQTEQGDKRSSIEVSTNQLELIGVQKTSVEKMNLIAKIPISGRILSSSSVAFQVYEKEE